MNLIPANLPSLLVFVGILIAVVSAIVLGAYYARANPGAVGLGIVIWLGVLSWVVSLGIFETEPARVLPFLAACNLAAVVFALSPIGRRLAMGLPLAALVGFQVFRLPLELVLHSWATQGVIPVTMTWDGSNLDILSGALALIAAPLVSRFRSVAWVFNLVGITLLVNVARVAILSSPLPFAWQVEPPLLLAFHLPYALIVPVCVAGALGGHIVLTRRLLDEKSP